MALRDISSRLRCSDRIRVHTPTHPQDHPGPLKCMSNHVFTVQCPISQPHDPGSKVDYLEGYVQHHDLHTCFIALRQPLLHRFHKCRGCSLSRGTYRQSVHLQYKISIDKRSFSTADLPWFHSSAPVA